MNVRDSEVISLLALTLAICAAPKFDTLIRRAFPSFLSAAQLMTDNS